MSEIPEDVMELVKRARAAAQEMRDAWYGDEQEDAVLLDELATALEAAAALSAQAVQPVALPRLTEAMMRAACKAHYGTDNIDGTALTAFDYDWSFRDAFKRMWKGVRSAMPATPPASAVEVVTDEDRIAYWKGAYERMAARNIEACSALKDAILVLDDLASGQGLDIPIEQVIRDLNAVVHTGG